MVSQRLAKPSSRKAVKVRILYAPFGSTDMRTPAWTLFCSVIDSIKLSAHRKTVSTTRIQGLIVEKAVCSNREPSSG